MSERVIQLILITIHVVWTHNSQYWKQIVEKNATIVIRALFHINKHVHELLTSPKTFGAFAVRKSSSRELCQEEAGIAALQRKGCNSTRSLLVSNLCCLELFLRLFGCSMMRFDILPQKIEVIKRFFSTFLVAVASVYCSNRCSLVPS